MQTFRSRQFLFMAIALVAITAAIGYFAHIDDFLDPEPSKSEMRAFRIRQLSDDQIRELKASSDTDALRFKSLDEDSRKNAWKDTQERNAKCSDIAYKTRNETECSRGIPLGLLYEDTRLTPSADKIFEGKILGDCRYVLKTSEARKMGCLAPQ